MKTADSRGVYLYTLDWEAQKTSTVIKANGYALAPPYGNCCCDFDFREPAHFPLRSSFVANDRHRFSELLRLSVGCTSWRAANATLQSALVGTREATSRHRTSGGPIQLLSANERDDHVAIGDPCPDRCKAGVDCCKHHRIDGGDPFGRKGVRIGMAGGRAHSVAGRGCFG